MFSLNIWPKKVKVDNYLSKINSLIKQIGLDTEL